jgi:hypothetical protein
MKIKQLVGRMNMKQQVGRTNGFVLGFFSWSNNHQCANRAKGSWGMAWVVLGFFSKWTVQINQQRERTARDKINGSRIKLTIATLIQRYNMAIVSS